MDYINLEAEDIFKLVEDTYDVWDHALEWRHSWNDKIGNQLNKYTAELMLTALYCRGADIGIYRPLGSLYIAFDRYNDIEGEYETALECAVMAYKKVVLHQ